MNEPADPTKERSQHEDDVLKRIAKIVAPVTPVAGEYYVGDDAAVLKPFVGQAIVSTDVAVLGVHLDPALFALRDLGYKAVTSALSDLAAMGARPRGVVIAVTAPTGTDLDELHIGAVEAAEAELNARRSLGVICPRARRSGRRGDRYAGGVTPGGGAVLRSGALPGDDLLVSGPLGRAAAGLRRRRAGVALSDELVQAHRRPVPRLHEGMAARGAGVHAMMDLSDGIGLDLHRFADASGVGFELDDLPVAEGATLEEAISGGEDYELLIATDDIERLREVFRGNGLSEPLRIGRVVSDASVRTLNGEQLVRRGYEHRL